MNNVITGYYPGFPTDAQPILMAMATVADGTGIFTNTRHYILAVGAEGDTVCLLDPNYKSGKFKQYEEAGLLRIDEELGARQEELDSKA